MKAFSSGFWILDSGSCFYIARKQATLAIACFLPQLVSPVKGGQARLGSIVSPRSFSNLYFEGETVFSIPQEVQNCVNPNISRSITVIPLLSASFNGLNCLGETFEATLLTLHIGAKQSIMLRVIKPTNFDELLSSLVAAGERMETSGCRK